MGIGLSYSPLGSELSIIIPFGSISSSSSSSSWLSLSALSSSLALNKNPELKQQKKNSNLETYHPDLPHLSHCQYVLLEFFQVD